MKLVAPCAKSNAPDQSPHPRGDVHVILSPHKYSVDIRRGNSYVCRAQQPWTVLLESLVRFTGLSSSVHFAAIGSPQNMLA
jgi:hypothetical protein